MKKLNSFATFIYLFLLSTTGPALSDSSEDETKVKNKNIFLDLVKPHLEHCHTSLGERGRCMPLNDCPGLRDYVEGKNNDRIASVVEDFGCGFRKVVYVCCTERHTLPFFEGTDFLLPEGTVHKPHIGEHHPPLFPAIHPEGHHQKERPSLEESIGESFIRPVEERPDKKAPEWLGGSSNTGFGLNNPASGESGSLFGSSRPGNQNFGSSGQGIFSNERPLSQGFGSSNSNDRRPVNQGFGSSGLSSQGLGSSGLSSQGFGGSGLSSQGLGSSGLSSQGFGSSGLSSQGPQQFNNFGNERPSNQGFGNGRPGNGRPFGEGNGRPGNGFNSDRRPDRDNRPGNQSGGRRPVSGSGGDSFGSGSGSFFNEDFSNQRPSNQGSNNQRPNNQRPNNQRRPGSGGSDKRRLLPDGNCGIEVSDKIIGGEDTKLDEFPWMALLHFSTRNGQDRGHGCGGSLINDRYVLTAAHCIKGSSLPDNIVVNTVRLGEYDLTKEKDCLNGVCSPSPIDAAVEDIIVHPEYKPSDRAQHHDIALIRLRNKVPFSAYISPICLPRDELLRKDYTGKKLVVSGWGKIANGANAKSSAIKQKVSLPFVSLENCKPFYDGINIRLRNSQMCAGGERAKDSCQGDSGGPLMSSEIINGQSSWFATGIVSFGPEDCGVQNIAGVYTKVSDYVDWILDNMRE
ncbi:UNVERIFIED_CONTAM: hypothetical protein PYX00_007823 [Menopon gallinae]|uniref:CLIP domain-containing serine protease n=1 Tax=Menopon gallinae TaxID=328185 RepID=A0AAW2HLQ6_9NEOP